MSQAAADTALAALLFAVDPAGLGGVALRGRPGPVRDAFLTLLRACLDPAAPVRRMPLNIAEGRLVGGLDIAATLRAGRPIAERGILAQTDGGVVLVAMAERLADAVAAQLCATIDTGMVVTARDGIVSESLARIGFVALDEGEGDDEKLSPALLDRMAFRLELQAGLDEDSLAYDLDAVTQARVRLRGIEASDAVIAALSGTALALGVWSLRGALLALRVARASAALAGRAEIAMEDATVAARLVLAPRATRVPAAEEQLPEDQPGPDEESIDDATDPADPAPSQDETPEPESDGATNEIPLDDVVLDAATAAIPAGLLAQLKADFEQRVASRSQGKSGALKKSGKRGRPAGIRRGAPGPNARLNLVETLRAAAPWQRLRPTEGGEPGRIQVRFDDFHISRFRERTETTTIFAVDASGSAAATRLAEAKGAVELLLADCYIRRDTVAVVSFRGKGAHILLPPTRSLVRAKRSLSGLPGGGGTPLAAGLDAAEALAASVQRRGGTPVIVVLTDGKSNVGRNGLGGRAAAEAEALQSASAIRRQGRAVLLVDTATRPSALAQMLAAAMSARYLPLPYVDAARLTQAVQTITPKSR
jgi:magnesium chelatase subunit D